MKVLRKPTAETVWSVKVYCTGFGNATEGCGAKLKVFQEDLRYYPGVPGDSWGSREAAVSFKCICCGAVSDLGRKDWPKGYNKLIPFTKEWRDAGIDDS